MNPPDFDPSLAFIALLLIYIAHKLGRIDRSLRTSADADKLRADAATRAARHARSQS